MQLFASIILTRRPLVTQATSKFLASYYEYSLRRRGELCRTLAEDFYPTPVTSASDDTPAAAADLQTESRQSLNRELRQSLYYVVKDNGQWCLPTTAVNSQEKLHEAAKRMLKMTSGGSMETWLVGRAPIGHAFSDSSRGTQVFYMKAHILSGKPQSNHEHAWLTREELRQHMGAVEYQSVEDLLSLI